MGEPIRFPKPDQIKLSPELAKGIADFKSAMIEADEVMSRRAGEIMAALAASIEKGKQDRAAQVAPSRVPGEES